MSLWLMHLGTRVMTHKPYAGCTGTGSENPASFTGMCNIFVDSGGTVRVVQGEGKIVVKVEKHTFQELEKSPEL